MRRFLWLIVPLALLTVRTSSADTVEPPRVSLINLIAAPQSYDGKVVFVEGVLNLEFEGDALYLHIEDRDFHIFKNAVWLVVPEQERRKWAALNGRHVLLVGRVDANLQGHFRAYAAALKDIERVEPLSKRKGK